MSDHHQKTDTLGYYNAQTFPISVEIPGTGERIELNPGKFITTKLTVTDKDTGVTRIVDVTVNDPGLMSLVNPRILARKVSATPVRVIPWPTLERVRRQQAASGFKPGAAYNPITSMPTFQTDATGKIITSSKPPEGAPVAPAVTHGLTMAEAAARGIHYGRPAREVAETPAPAPTPAPVPQPPRQPQPEVLTPDELPVDILEGTESDPNWTPPTDLADVMSAAAAASGVELPPAAPAAPAAPAEKPAALSAPEKLTAPAPSAETPAETPAPTAPPKTPQVDTPPATKLPPAVKLPAPQV